MNFKQEEKRKHFLNTLTADGEYFRHNSKSLLLPIQVQLSKKVKTFCWFSESTFWTFWKINKRHSLRISEIIDSERRGYLNAQKILFLKILPQSTGKYIFSKYFRYSCQSRYFLITTFSNLLSSAYSSNVNKNWSFFSIPEAGNKLISAMGFDMNLNTTKWKQKGHNMVLWDVEISGKIIVTDIRIENKEFDIVE